MPFFFARRLPLRAIFYAHLSRTIYQPTMVKINILWHAMQLLVTIVNPFRSPSKWNFPCPSYRVSMKKSPLIIESREHGENPRKFSATLDVVLYVFFILQFFYRLMNVRNFINGLILAIERYCRENRDSWNWSLNGKMRWGFSV